MPKIVSQRQFRWAQAVAHGNAHDAHGLSAAKAQEGLDEMKGSYGSLPARAGSVINRVASARAKSAMRKSKKRQAGHATRSVMAARSARSGR